MFVSNFSGVQGSTTIVPQRQLSTGSTISSPQTLSTPTQPPKFVIVKPGINIQQQAKPNIVVMNPPGSTTSPISSIAAKQFTTNDVQNVSYVIQETPQIDDLSHLE